MSREPAREEPGLGTEGRAEEVGSTPLMVIRGDATDEEVAALVAVVQTMAAATSLAAATDEPPKVSTWASPARKVRTVHPHGPGGWRASALPR